MVILWMDTSFLLVLLKMRCVCESNLWLWELTWEICSSMGNCNLFELCSFKFVQEPKVSSRPPLLGTTGGRKKKTTPLFSGYPIERNHMKKKCSQLHDYHFMSSHFDDSKLYMKSSTIFFQSPLSSCPTN